MNTLDIILLIILTLAGVDGWRRGVIVQVCGIAGLLLGIWLAINFCHKMEQWLHLGQTTSTILGFIIIIILSVLALGLVGFLFKKIFRLTGFGIIDNIGGVILAVLKIGLLAYFITSTFCRMNDRIDLIPKKIIAESKVYKTMGTVADSIFPFLITATNKLLTETKTNNSHEPTSVKIKK